MNDPAESIFARVKNEILKFGMLSFANAAGVSQSKMNGDFNRIFGGSDASGLGFFHKLDPEMQTALIIFAEYRVNAVCVGHRNALKSHREHTSKRHEEERKKHQASLEKKYEQELRLHKMIFSEAAWMTEAEVDKALTKLSTETKKLDAVKEQWRIWNQGAGWKDEHQAFSKKKEKFKSQYLVSQLKKNIIRKHVLKKRAVRACPSPPFSSVKTLPEIGDTLCDVLSMKEEEVEREREVMNVIFDKCGLTRQPIAMPKLDSLVGKCIDFFRYADEEDAIEKGQGKWRVGEVLRVNDDEVTIEWDGDYEDPDDQVTIEELKEEDWVCQGQTLHEGSWRLA